MPPSIRRFFVWLTHRHTFLPVALEVVDDFTGEAYHVVKLRCTCGAERRDASRLIGVAVIAALTLQPVLAAAQAVCAVDPAAFDPSLHYVMSPEQTARLLVARESIVRRNAHGEPDPNGLICILGTGMSSAKRLDTALYQLLKNEPWKSLKAPGVRYVRASEAGQTVRHWDDITDPMWQDALAKLANDGCSPPQVALVLSVLTQEQPAREGLMTWADVAGVNASVAHYFPHALHQISPHPFTGYIAPKFALKVPDAIIAQDAALLRDFAEVGGHPAFAFFRDLRSQGTIMDTMTGVDWQCSDVDPVDGHHPVAGLPPDLSHPNGTGAKKLGTLLLRWWQMALPQVVRP